MDTSIKQKGIYSLRIDASYVTGRAYVVDLYNPSNNFTCQIHCVNTESKEALEWFANHADAEICGWAHMLLDVYSRLGLINHNVAGALWDLIQADELNGREIGKLKQQYPHEKGVPAFEAGLDKLKSFAGANSHLRNLLMGVSYNTVSDAAELFYQLNLIKTDSACTLKIDDRTAIEKPQKETKDFEYVIVLRKGLASGVIAEILNKDLHEIIKTPLNSVSGAIALKNLIQRDSVAAVAACHGFINNILGQAMNCDKLGIRILELMYDKDKSAEVKKAGLSAIAETTEGRDKQMASLSGSFNALFAIEGLAQEMCDILADSELARIANIEAFLFELKRITAERKDILVNDQLPSPTSQVKQHMDELGHSGRALFFKN